MSYQVIARKYRPQRFSDVVGQEHVTRTLSQAIAKNRIAHAYLFCGPRGTGKTTIARIFAKCLNATGGPKVDFSEDDPRCQEIAEGRSLDVLEIDAASNRGIDEIRGLRETVRYAPASSRYKIYIIDEVHMLTKEAFNALLKTLEEPPEHVKFMFATTEPEKVLPTILSRCQRFDLRRIPAALMVEHLAIIAKKESVKADPAALLAIARGAEGGLRDAESTLDQLISFCGHEIEEADVLAMFGLTAQSQLMELARAILEGETSLALRQLNDLAAAGKDLGRLLSNLLEHFRNLLVYCVSQGDLKMLEITEAEAAALAGQVCGAQAEGLTRVLEVLAEAELRFRDAASKKILLEISVLKAIEARRAINLDTVLEKLRAAREVSPAASPKPPASTSSRASAPSTVSPPGPVASEPSPPAPPSELRETREPISGARGASAEELEVLWAAILEAVSRASPFLRSQLHEAHPVSFAKNLLTIGYPAEFVEQIGLVDHAKSHALLQTKLSEQGYAGAQVRFVKAEPARPRSAAIASPTAPMPTARSASAMEPRENPAVISKESFKNDPLIQKALELFKGQIVRA